MDKPEDVHEYALKVSSDLRISVFEITKESARIWGHEGVIEAMNSAIKEAILSAQSQAYIDAARIADEIANGRDRQSLEAKAHREKEAARDFESMAMSAIDVSAAILQRKEEIGR